MDLPVFMLYMRTVPSLGFSFRRKNEEAEAYIDQRMKGSSHSIGISFRFLSPKDEGVNVSGASYDMLVVEPGDNKDNYKPGRALRFNLRCMGAPSLLNPRYTDKEPGA